MITSLPINTETVTVEVTETTRKRQRGRHCDGARPRRIRGHTIASAVK
jgi:hypothetical protein